MSDSVKANRFNVKRILYAEVVKDDATAYQYGPIKDFAAPMAVQFTPSYASGTLYGRGVKTEDMTKLTGGMLKVDVNKVPIEVRSDIYNHAFVNGILRANENDQAKTIAIGYEIEQTGDNRELTWFPRCKARPFGNNHQQSNDNINFSTDSIEIAVMPREFDGTIHIDGDTANSDFSDEDAEAFLDTIPDGTLATEE